MRLDIRVPLGMLFALLGAILTLSGLLSDPSVYERSLGYNVNLGWGLILVAFAGICLHLTRRARVAARPAGTDPEGRAIERSEHDTGQQHSHSVADSRSPRRPTPESANRP